MAKIKLSVVEMIGLEAELNGLVNQQSGEVVAKGLLGESLDLVVKYRLKKLADALAAEKKTVDELLEELVKKYGEEDEEGRISIPMFTDAENKVKSEDFIEFEKQYNDLLADEKEFDYTPLKVKDLAGIKSGERYDIVFRLIEE